MTRTVTPDTAKLDALFEPHDKGDRPGLAVGIAYQGRPLYRRGFGLASMELPVILAPTMRLRIGSTSKHFTCLAIMLLAERGKLSQHDSVRRYIPELGDWAEPITLAQLMNHTGGVRCSLDILTAISNVMSRPLPHAEQVKLLTKLRSTNFAPGSSWSYSNGGYVLLTEIIRRLGETSYEDFVRENIFVPVGMNDTVARPVDTDFLPNSASLHVPAPGGGYTHGVFGPDIGGEGSIVSTVDDMLRWLNHMAHPVVGSAETWREMMTPAQLNNGKSTGYGYGLTMTDFRGVRTVGHSGVVAGGLCQMLKLVDEQIDIIIMTNTSGINPGLLANQIIESMVDGLNPVPETVPGDFPTGDFLSNDTGRYFRIAEKDGLPQIDITSAQVPIQRRADGTAWFQSNLFTGAVFAPSGDGIDVIEFETPDHLQRITPPDRAEAPEIAGTYRADEIDAIAEVTDGDPPHLIVSGPFGKRDYEMSQRGPGFWALLADGAVYQTLERDGDDLLLSSTRAFRLRLTREHS